MSAIIAQASASSSLKCDVTTTEDTRRAEAPTPSIGETRCQTSSDRYRGQLMRLAPWSEGSDQSASLITKGGNALGFSDATRGGRVAGGTAWRPRSAQARNRGVGFGRTDWVYGDLKRWIALGSARHIGSNDLLSAAAVQAMFNMRCPPGIGLGAGLRQHVTGEVLSEDEARSYATKHHY